MFNLKHRIVPLLSAFLLSVASMPNLADIDWPEVPPAEAPAHWGAVSANFEEIPYPYPVHFLELNRFQQDIRMAYMDVPPSGRANGQTVFIQHGMNFYSEAYTPTIKALSDAGFRVIAVDRIGYGKSTKPILPYSFNFVAANMKSLLDELEIEEVAIFGHSMGGMTVSRFAMVYPDITTHVVMVKSDRPNRSAPKPTLEGPFRRGRNDYVPVNPAWPSELLPTALAARASGIRASTIWTNHEWRMESRSTSSQIAGSDAL